VVTHSASAMTHVRGGGDDEVGVKNDEIGCCSITFILQLDDCAEFFHLFGRFFRRVRRRCRRRRTGSSIVGWLGV
jgi:hypothetical protein